MVLRQAGITGMILNVGSCSRPEVELLLTHDISQSVYSEAVPVLVDEARQAGEKAKVHICLDSG